MFKDQWDQPEMWVFQDNLGPEEIVDQSDPKVSCVRMLSNTPLCVNVAKTQLVVWQVHVVVMDLQARMALQELKVHPVCLDLSEYLAHQER